MTKKEEIAWAGGFYEGEGCLSFSGWTWQMVVSNADLEPLEKFQRIVGVGKVRQESNRNGQRPMFRWYIHRSNEIEDVVEMLWAHLSKRRQNQILDTVDKRQEYLSSKPSNHGPARGSTYKRRSIVTR